MAPVQEVPRERKHLTVAMLGEGRMTSISGDDATAAAVAAKLSMKSKTVGTRGAYVMSSTDEDMEDRPSEQEKDLTVMVPKSMTDDEGKAFLKEHGVAWSCKKGHKPESPNQDSFSALVMENECALYGVYDGHGPYGHDVSHIVKNEIVRTFLNHPQRGRANDIAFRDSFKATQQYLEENADKVDSLSSGTTCTMVYHDIVAQTLTVAHVGDSRCILGRPNAFGRRRAQALTADHKPEVQEELERILSADPPGRVVNDEGVYRVYCYGGDYPGVNMSRVLGDVDGHRKAGLTAEPDIAVVDLRAEGIAFGELTILLCSDGVWEFIDDVDAFNTLTRGKNRQAGIEQLAQDSIKLWLKDGAGCEEKTVDDITLIAVTIKPKGSSLGCLGGLLGPCAAGLAKHLSKAPVVGKAAKGAKGGEVSDAALGA